MDRVAGASVWLKIDSKVGTIVGVKVGLNVLAMGILLSELGKAVSKNERELVGINDASILGLSETEPVGDKVGENVNDRTVSDAVGSVVSSRVVCMIVGDEVDGITDGVA